MCYISNQDGGRKERGKPKKGGMKMEMTDSKKQQLIEEAIQRGYDRYMEADDPGGDQFISTDEYGHEVILIAQTDVDSVWVYSTPDPDGNILMAPYPATAYTNADEADFEARLTSAFDQVPDHYVQGVAWYID